MLSPSLKLKLLWVICHCYPADKFVLVLVGLFFFNLPKAVDDEVDWVRAQRGADAYQKVSLEVADVDPPLKPHRWFCFDGGGEVKVQKIILLLDLVPWGFNEFGLLAVELKVERKGAVKLNVQRNRLSLYYLLNYILVGCQPRSKLIELPFKPLYLAGLSSQQNLKAGSLCVLFPKLWLRQSCVTFLALDDYELTLPLVVLNLLLEKLLMAPLTLDLWVRRGLLL